MRAEVSKTQITATRLSNQSNVLAEARDSFDRPWGPVRSTRMVLGLNPISGIRR